MTPLCQGCARPSPDATACAPCVATLVDGLSALGWLDGELTITRSRQARLAGSQGRRTGNEQPMPYGTRASTVQDRLRTVVTTWARDVDEHARPGSVQAAADVLLLGGLSQHPAVGELIDDVRGVTTQALEAINPEEDDLAYGPCGAELDDGGQCDAHLYGAPGDSWVRCPRCRTQHETRDRVDWMRRRMESLHLPAATLARLLPRLVDRPVSADLIRAWRAQGKPIATSDGADGRPLYRVGDVVTVALTTPQRERKTRDTAA